VKIRPLETHNKKEVSRLLSQAKTFNDQEVQVALEVVGDALRRPEKGDYCAFCALNSNGDLVGYICFGPIPMTEGCYDLYWIVVDKAFSRRGVGGKLFEFMEDFVIKKGARRIYVDTSSTPPYEPARALYEKHGYRVVGLLEDFYRKGDHKMIFMKEVRAGV
jgi:ribosomal protein S18 acetylase RimI-like enzyme